jgi:hypothetical protein
MRQVQLLMAYQLRAIIMQVRYLVRVSGTRV